MVSEGMLPRAAVKAVEARLTAAGCPDADFDARELFRLATGRDVRLSDRPLDAAEAAKLEELTVRRAAREPLQYLCGSWPFLDFELAVGPGVLCPRADTEVVAETAAEMLAGVEAPRALDLCAGTGCLGLGVKRLCPAAQPRHRLEVARHEVEKTIPQPDRVRFVCDGWLHPRKHGLLPAGGRVGNRAGYLRQPFSELADAGD